MPAPAFTPRATLFALLAGVAAGPLAAAELPLQMPSYQDDEGNGVSPSLSLEGAFFPQSQSWFGKSKDNLGETSNYWFERWASWPWKDSIRSRASAPPMAR